MAGGSGVADMLLVCVIYPTSVCCDFPSFTKFARAFRTLLSHRRRTDGLQISKLGIGKDKKGAKYSKKLKKSGGDNDKTPSGIAIHSGQYSASNYNKLKPFEKAKVKQLHEEAKKKEKDSETHNVAAVTTKEDIAPEIEDGIKTLVTSNAESQFGRSAHVRQKLRA